ncbi:MAG TPA: SDR family NAD(P)-dependent oxidoreductase [Candidatus Saccharimonadales bacterium]|nr:SDR family NAD(P)-dependent oxidoreductase [Candidatus Saccharimonadales bacterium]
MHIVLGGTHGLGAEIAAQLRSAGEQTFVIGRSHVPADHGDGAKVDLMNARDVQDLIARLDSLVASETAMHFYWCAGISYMGDFAAQTNAVDMVAVNFAGPIPLVQHVWQQMLAKGTACRFVVVSSTTGVKARASEAVYAGTKHAQVGFARSLGLEAERLGAKIRVALFLPGGMQTQFWDHPWKPGSYEGFLDPKKVAQKMLRALADQIEPYYEETIERGSL